MYFYFYDKLVQDKKYEAVLMKIETRLIDQGINGRIEKLSIFKNARALVEDAIKKGAQTIVAVGDDRTFATIVNIVAPYNVTLGFIPIAEGSRFARVLGMESGDAACEALSRRLCENVDLGHVQDFYFIGALRAAVGAPLQLRCDNQYTVQTTQHTNTVEIMNMGDVLGSARLFPAHDKKLTVVIAPEVGGGFFSRRKRDIHSETVLTAKQIEVTSLGETATLAADDVATFNTPCTVEVVPHALKVIVGRDRLLK